MSGETKKFDASRRDFLKLMGFSFTGAALAACSRMPVEKVIPYLVKPEEVTPGVANWYATTCAGCTASCGLLVKVRDGRPIKIEGNELSPINRGGVCAVGQAMVLSLYDDSRLKGPLWEGKGISWEEMDQKIITVLEDVVRKGGKVALVSGTLVSPSTRALVGEWLAKFPGSRHVVYDPVSMAAIPEANQISFGTRVLPRYRFDRAQVIVGLNADFLGTWISPVEYARGYAQNRMKQAGQGPATMSHHVQFEARMSLTGSNADRRVPVAPSEIGGVALALLQEVSRLAGKGPAFGGDLAGLTVDQKIIHETARELFEHRGESLVVCGVNDVSLQVAVNALNSLLGNIGSTVDLDNPSLQKQGDDSRIRPLVEAMNRGEIGGLFLYGVNPLYDLPESEAFREGLKKVPLSVSFAGSLDETAVAVKAVCPDHHFLESWNDAQPVTFCYSMTQPALRPLSQTRAAQESLLRWSGREGDHYNYLRNFWRRSGLDSFWDQAVHDGLMSLPPQTSVSRGFTAPLAASVKIVLQELQAAASRQSKDRFEVEFYEKVGIRDGRHANNPWLQELPDPISKVTWDNYASVAPVTAAGLGLEEGDVVRLKFASRALEIPVQIQPGQFSGSIALALGYGRTECGKVGKGVGVNGYPFISTHSVVSLEKTGRHVELAATQTHHSMEGRPIVKETTLAEYLVHPASGNEGHEKLVSLWEERTKEGHAWGMVVDLTRCIGCSACLISCQAENNVAVVGKKEVRRGREMHWIRIDRYYNGSEDNPETVHQPMTCQHCGHAPCETVCPVLATTHSSDGLNQQIYNRCVGTRYCENNCPYKVRRFNWFNYAHNDRFDYHMNSELESMVLNPDVVVRSRGVMEKCSMCIQRIQEGRLVAKREGRPLQEGDIRLACQQSCPTEAIVFGDLNNPANAVTRLNKEGRFYHVLEELGVKPVVGYLTKVRNKT